MNNNKWSVWRRYTSDAAILALCNGRTGTKCAGEWELYAFGAGEAELRRYYTAEMLRAHFKEVIWVAIDGFAVWDNTTCELQYCVTKGGSNVDATVRAGA